MKKAITMIILSLVCFTTLGQGSRYEMKGDGFGNYNLKGKTFFIAPADSTVSIRDLEFREYAHDLATLLQYEGAIETKDFPSADMCILLYYAITDNTYVESIPVPIRGIVGSVSNTYSNTNTNTNTYGSVYGNAYGSTYGNSASVYGNAYGNSNTYQNSSTSTTTYTTPVYGTVGYSTSSQTRTEFLRVLNVYAYDNRITTDPEMLWKFNLRSSGSSSSLRNVIPMMCFAATGEGVGKNFSIDFYVQDNEERVKYFLEACNNTAITTVRKGTSPNLVLRYVKKDEGHTDFIYTLSAGKNETLPKEIYLEADGQHYNLLSVDDSRPTKRVGNYSSKGRYVKLSFQEIPESCHEVSIINGDGFSVSSLSIH